MATQTPAAFSVGPKTLSGTTIDKVTLTRNFRYIDVHNLSGTADLTVTVARGGDPADPAAGASDDYVIPQGRSRTIEAPGARAEPDTVVVKVLGNGNSYLVEGVG